MSFILASRSDLAAFAGTPLGLLWLASGIGLMIYYNANYGGSWNVGFWVWSGFLGPLWLIPIIYKRFTEGY